MASIKLETFGGLIPRVVNQRRMPRTSATRAQDVDLVSGALVPITVAAPFQTLHDDEGDLKGEVDPNELEAITKPAAVTKASEIYMCVPDNWLEVEMDCWISYTKPNESDPDKSDYVLDHITDMSTREPRRIKYTDDGFIAYFQLQEITFDAMAKDGLNYNYVVHGPKFRFRLEQDTNYKGGPETTYTYPEDVLTSADAEVPIFSHPLTYPISMSGYDAGNGVGIDRYVYGFLELVDYEIPYLQQEITVEKDVVGYQLSPTNAEASFRFRCNYTRNTQQMSLYRQTLVDEDLEREGPPSDASQVFVTDPGKILRLQLQKDVTYTKTNLYRSFGGGDESYYLLTEDAGGFTGDTDFDTFTGNATVQLEPYGNYPHDTAEQAAENSLWHPAGWAVIFFENQVRPSAVYRPWAYPDEYAIEMPTDILAGTIVGNSILVFTSASDTEEGKVYAISGNDPEFLSVYKLSDGDPLLNPVSLARIRGRVFWTSYDGLMTTDGSSVVNVTEPFFTREEWLEEEPETMSAYTSENTVWLVNPGNRSWRVDIGEKDREPFAFLSTFTAFSGKEFFWESKIFEFPVPVCFSHVRVLAEGYPIAVELIDQDEEVQGQYMAFDSRVFRVPRIRSEREWKLRIHGNNTTYFVGLATSAKELSGDGA